MIWGSQSKVAKVLVQITPGPVTLTDWAMAVRESHKEAMKKESFFIL
jgi:hypothetical protein